VLEGHLPLEGLFLTDGGISILIILLVTAGRRSVFLPIPNSGVKRWVELALLTILHNVFSMVLFLKALKTT
jgi:hypothetical protein